MYNYVVSSLYECYCGRKLDQGQDKTCSNFCYKNQIIKTCYVCGASQSLINDVFVTSDESLQTEGKHYHRTLFKCGEYNRNFYREILNLNAFTAAHGKME